MRLFAGELGLYKEELPGFHHSWDVLAIDVDEDGNRNFVEAERYGRAT